MTWLERAVDEANEQQLEQLIDASAAALALPIDPAWKPTIKANLEVTLRLAQMVAELELPDEAEPAPVFEAALTRIAARNPVLNAFTTVTAERALAKARAADEAVARGKNPGPLA